jgi:hypothetical protein
MSDDLEKPSETKSNLHRSIPKTLRSFGAALYWFAWDWFWEKFNLASVGDEVKEHSVLMKKRVAVFITLIVIFILGGALGVFLQHSKLEEAKETIRQLREFNAGHPTTKSPAELMGLHDQTNFYFLTNTIVTTNQITLTHVETLTNSMVFFASNPVLDLFQLEAIQKKLNPAPHLPISILWREDDLAAMPLSKQIAQVFMIEGFEVKLNTLPKSFEPLRNGIYIVHSSKLSISDLLRDAINSLGLYLGQAPFWDIETSFPTNIVAIIVATKGK